MGAMPGRTPFERADASKVTDQLWIGGDLSSYDEELAGAQLRELVEHGLTHILDVREEWSDEQQVARSQPQLHYLWQGIPDLGQLVDVEWFDAGVDFALEALASPDNVLLAHCHAGINRGPSIGFAILLALGLEPIEALEEIRRARPIVMVAYAEDALRWAHDRLEMEHDLDTDLGRLAVWRTRKHAELIEILRLHRNRGD
jgi:dual specificity phosphatase 3